MPITSWASAAGRSTASACSAHALRDWCRLSPGAPGQNPFVESFHGRVRDELLNSEQFACPAEAKVVIGDWHEDHHTRRPHSALGMRTPAAFAAAGKTEPPTLTARPAGERAVLDVLAGDRQRGVDVPPRATNSAR